MPFINVVTNSINTIKNNANIRNNILTKTQCRFFNDKINNKIENIFLNYLNITIRTGQVVGAFSGIVISTKIIYDDYKHQPAFKAIPIMSIGGAGGFLLGSFGGIVGGPFLIPASLIYLGCKLAAKNEKVSLDKPKE